MIYKVRIARKGGKVICRNCERRIRPGYAYIRVKRASYCVMCDGPRRHVWRELE